MPRFVPLDRILITGSGGQLGSELSRRLGPRGVGVDLPEFDLAAPESVREAFARHRPGAVINAAAYTRVDLADSEPENCRRVNVRGVEHLAEVCRTTGTRLIQISTDYVFDGRKAAAYIETDATNPLNVYGLTKLEAEQIAAELPHHLIVRTAGLFGPAGPNSAGNFVETMLRLADCGQTIRVVADQFVSPTFTRHLAQAIDSLISVRTAGIYHVVNSGIATWHDVAREVFRIAGKRVDLQPIGMDQYACAARRPRSSALDSGKYDRLPRRFPMPSWRAALAEYLSLRNPP